MKLNGYNRLFASVEWIRCEPSSTFVLGLPGCHSQGKTKPEALQNISDAIYEYFEVVNELAQHKWVREVEVEL